MADNSAKLCGAKNRSGGTCKKAAGYGTDHLGTGRCKFHGGASHGAPKGSANAIKHGIYSKALKPDERDVWGRIPLDSLDDELKIAKLQLARALEEKNAEMAQRLMGRIVQIQNHRLEAAKAEAEGISLSDNDTDPESEGMSDDERVSRLAQILDAGAKDATGGAA